MVLAVRRRCDGILPAATMDDPLLQALGPNIRQELHGDDAELQGGSFQQLLHKIAELPLLRQRGRTVLMTRWASWMDATEWMLPQLTARLLIRLYPCLQLGYVRRKAMRNL